MAIEAERKWYDNVDQNANFLSSVNRFLNKEAVRDMFYVHLDLTKQESTFMINMDYQKDNEVYDKIEKQASEIADTIADSLAKLYLNMFS